MRRFLISRFPLALTLLSAACSYAQTEPVADPRFISTHFSGSGNCATCHNGLKDPSGKDVSIETDWASTMMANSTRDPFWRAKLASELRRNPQLSSVVNDKCTRCHAPMANVEAKHDGAPVQVFNGGFLDAQNAYFDHAMNGVSCTVCHQIQDNGKLGTLKGFSGKYSIGTYANPVNRLIFGQYSNPRVAPMQNQVQYTQAYGAHTASWEMCATCHNLKTPFVDAAGNVVSTTPESEFPEQMVYSEWKHSVFASTGAEARSCVGCHMPEVDGVVISNRPFNLSPRNGFGKHYFVGGNTMMLNMLDTHRTAVGVTATGFATTIARTRDVLASAASLQVLSASRSGGQLTVRLQVDNSSGHKLPSSYPSRRAWLHVTVKDGAGNVLFESGGVNADGSIIGVDADASPSLYEPHYDVITQGDQVQVYESIMGDTDGNLTYTLLRAATYLKDNRLLPRGFDKATAPSDIRVMGGAASDASFIGGSDTLTYQVPVSGSGTLTVSAELLFQSMAYGFVQDLASDAADPYVARFLGYYDQAPLRSERIASVSVAVP